MAMESGPINRIRFLRRLARSLLCDLLSNVWAVISLYMSITDIGRQTQTIPNRDAVWWFVDRQCSVRGEFSSSGFAAFSGVPDVVCESVE